MTTIRTLLNDSRGATAVEFAAIASLISVAAIGAFLAVGTSVVGLFERVPAF